MLQIFDRLRFKRKYCKTLHFVNLWLIIVFHLYKIVYKLRPKTT
jgi:hypothetical protein